MNNSPAEMQSEINEGVAVQPLKTLCVCVFDVFVFFYHRCTSM